MEKYLINPLWIYLIDLFTGFEVLAVITLIIASAVAIGFAVAVLIVGESGYEEFDGQLKSYKKVLKTSFIWAIILGVVVCVIPSEKTMYTMFVTSYITEENINSATETVTDVVDYIFEKVDELQGE